MASLLVEAVNQFGLKFHMELTKEETNVFFSPLSLSMALSMLLRGAKNETALELKRALEFDKLKLSDEDVHSHFQQMLTVYTESQEFYSLAVANALVCHKEYPFINNYKLDLVNFYKALVMEVDFYNESINAVNEINSWVKTNTKNKISKLFEFLDPETIMVLLNSVYFKGDWEHKFKVDRTHDGNFYNKGNLKLPKTVPLMNITKKFLFAEKETFKVLELPYKGNDIAMLIFLPNEMDGLKNLEKSLSGNFLVKIKEELTENKVHVTIPKMHTEYSKELTPILKSLGINLLFDQGADLTGVSQKRNLQASQVFHKAVLDVNEEGSEAAAVTAIVIGLTCRMNPIFRVDHPFLFLIYDRRSNLILFMGRINEF